MDITTFDFPYTNNITCVSKKQFDAHKILYSAYAVKANEIHGLINSQKDAVGNATYSLLRGLEKGQSYALAGVILHELYFSNLGGDRGDCGKCLMEKLCESFGSYEHWALDFKACAQSARGWAVLAYEQRSKAFVNMLLDTHDEGVIMGSFPLLVLDMYEHAYFYDYLNNKDEYINKFMDNINWNTVCARYDILF